MYFSKSKPLSAAGLPSCRYLSTATPGRNALWRDHVNGGAASRKARLRAGAFTLIEILVAVSILALTAGIAMMALTTALSAWQQGTAVAERLHHADFVVEQLTMALRSAYYRGGADGNTRYGFSIRDEGYGPGSSDVISWVKMGSALVGRDKPYASGPHRVEFFVDQDAQGRPAAGFRAWGILEHADDFDYDEIEPEFIASRIIGFECRMEDPDQNRQEGESIDWIDDWELTNRIPRTVEVTVWLEPPADSNEPISIQRVIAIPVAPLSWQGMPQSAAVPVVVTPEERSETVATERGARSNVPSESGERTLTVQPPGGGLSVP